MLLGQTHWSNFLWTHYIQARSCSAGVPGSGQRILYRRTAGEGAVPLRVQWGGKQPIAGTWRRKYKKKHMHRSGRGSDQTSNAKEKSNGVKHTNHCQSQQNTLAWPKPIELSASGHAYRSYALGKVWTMGIKWGPMHYDQLETDFSKLSVPSTIYTFENEITLFPFIVDQIISHFCSFLNKRMKQQFWNREGSLKNPNMLIKTVFWHENWDNWKS